VLEVAFGKGTTDPPKGSMVDPVDPDLEDPGTLVYLEEGSNVSEEVEESVIL